MSQRVRDMKPEEIAVCEAILRSLPDWFGIESSIVDYVRDLGVMETLVAEEDGNAVGFLTLKYHNPQAEEIHVMGVRGEHHGNGLGRALVREAESRLAARGREFVQVKTLGPSHPDKGYAGTRAFYLRMGYVPLEEHKLWGDANPCLVLVKHLACGGAGPDSAPPDAPSNPPGNTPS